MPTIYICGDSTAATYPENLAPAAGWGQLFGDCFDAPAAVSNHAYCGRSSKSFLAEGRLNAIEQVIQPGDFLFIQFAHNDNAPYIWRHTDPWTSYRHTLGLYIDTAREYGATPVLLTPICQRLWSGDGSTLMPSHEDYAQAAFQVGSGKSVPVIDALRRTMACVQAAGETGSKALYMHFAPGENPHHPNGLADNTHTRHAGALAFARLIAADVRGLGLSISSSVKEDIAL